MSLLFLSNLVFCLDEKRDSLLLIVKVTETDSQRKLKQIVPQKEGKIRRQLETQRSKVFSQ